MAEDSKSFRAFIAVNLPAEVLARVVRFQQELRTALPKETVRWTRTDQVHLTLRFLGNVPENDASQLEEALRRACAPTGPFRLCARGGGCFPGLRRPKILWVGITGEVEALAQLQVGIERETARWGELEDRKFHPHLTIGRLKEPDRHVVRALTQAVESAKDLEFGVWLVEQVELMRSELSAEGAHHSLVARLALGGAAA